MVNMDEFYYFYQFGYNNRCDDKDCSRDGYYETLDECELRSYDLYQKIKLGEIKIGRKEL